jgi:peptidylprolyl isomerase
VFDDAGFLDGQYTVWGRVESGMEHVDAIKKGDSARNGTVANPDKIVKMQVAADAAE